MMRKVKRELAKLDNGEGFLEQTPDVNGGGVNEARRKSKTGTMAAVLFSVCCVRPTTTHTPPLSRLVGARLLPSFLFAILSPSLPSSPLIFLHSFSLRPSFASSRFRFFPRCCNQNPRLRPRYLPNKANNLRLAWQVSFDKPE